MKLRKKVIEGSKTTVTDYLDGYQYIDGVLEFYPHAENYVNMKGGTPEYVYNYKLYGSYRECTSELCK